MWTYYGTFLTARVLKNRSHKSKIYLFLIQDASIILMKYRAGATITNGAGETPLHIAARYIIIPGTNDSQVSYFTTHTSQVPYYTTDHI